MKRSLIAIAIIPSLILVSVASAATDAPQFKPGLWEMHTKLSGDRNGERSNVSKMCLDAGAMANDEYNRKNCSKYETRQEGNKWILDSVCKVGSGTMSTHAVIQSTGDSAYHQERSVNYDPPLAGRSHKNIIIDAKRLSSCKP